MNREQASRLLMFVSSVALMIGAVAFATDYSNRHVVSPYGEQIICKMGDQLSFQSAVYDYVHIVDGVMRIEGDSIYMPRGGELCTIAEVTREKR